MLAAIEFILCVLAVAVAIYMRFDGKVSDDDFVRYNIQSPVLSALIFGAVMPGTMLAMGLYQSRFRGGVLGVFLRSIVGFLAGSVILALLYYLVPNLYLGRGVFALAILMAFFMVGTIRPLFFYYADRNLLRLRTLVIGTGETAASIHRRLRRKVDRRGFEIVGYVSLGDNETISVEQAKIVRPLPDLLGYCQHRDIDEIVVAPDDRRSGVPMHDLLQCKLYGIDVLEILSFFEREQGKLPIDMLNPHWLIYSDGFEQSQLKDVVKRLFDILASLLILAITWPFMVLAWLAIKLEDGWEAPTLYHQVRIGHLGQSFTVLKFRSMRVDAEAPGSAVWAQKNDARITRTGAFIRRVRIDELPQIFNVLLGDMSFVGPRPERPQFVEDLEKTIPYYAERHAVKPGITGWAQVCYPYGASHEDSVRKHEYDLYYIKNHTIFLDVLILAQTAEVVLFGKGAR